MKETIKATEENRLIFLQYILTHFNKSLKEFNTFCEKLTKENRNFLNYEIYIYLNN